VSAVVLFLLAFAAGVAVGAFVRDSEARRKRQYDDGYLRGAWERRP